MEIKTEMRSAYAQKLEAQLTVWKAEFELVKARLGNAAAEGNVALVKEAEVWAEREKAAVAKLEELKLAGEAGWETLKAGVESAWGDLQKSVEHALKH